MDCLPRCPSLVSMKHAHHNHPTPLNQETSERSCAARSSESTHPPCSKCNAQNVPLPCESTVQSGTRPWPSVFLSYHVGPALSHTDAVVTPADLCTHALCPSSSRTFSLVAVHASISSRPPPHCATAATESTSPHPHAPHPTTHGTRSAPQYKPSLYPSACMTVAMGAAAAGVCDGPGGVHVRRRLRTPVGADQHLGCRRFALGRRLPPPPRHRVTERDTRVHATTGALATPGRGLSAALRAGVRPAHPQRLHGHA